MFGNFEAVQRIYTLKERFLQKVCESLKNIANEINSSFALKSYLLRKELENNNGEKFSFSYTHILILCFIFVFMEIYVLHIKL